MPQENVIRKFVDRSVERQLVREYLLKETDRAGFGGIHFEQAYEDEVMSTKISLRAERVGMVIGRRGMIINELQRRITDDFDLVNPKLQVEEIENPTTNAQVMASKLASALERGWYFRRAGHSTMLNIMDAGAKGCLIILSGKLTGSRHRTEKFQKGHIKFCGETAIQHMEIGFATAVKKLGTIGCTVALMKAGTKLPHEVEIVSRDDSGLEPYVESTPLDEEPSESVEISDEVAAELQEEIVDLIEQQAEVAAEQDSEDGEESEAEAEESVSAEEAEESAEEDAVDEPEESTEEEEAES